MYMYMVSQPFPSRNPQNPLRKNTQLIRVRLVKVRNTVEGQIDLTTKWPSVGPGGLPLFGEAYFQGQKRGNLLRDFLRMFFWLVVSWYQWVSRIVCVYIYKQIRCGKMKPGDGSTHDLSFAVGNFPVLLFDPFNRRNRISFRLSTESICD